MSKCYHAYLVIKLRVGRPLIVRIKNVNMPIFIPVDKYIFTPVSLLECTLSTLDCVAVRVVGGGRLVKGYTEGRTVCTVYSKAVHTHGTVQRGDTNVIDKRRIFAFVCLATADATSWNVKIYLFLILVNVISEYFCYFNMDSPSARDAVNALPVSVYHLVIPSDQLLVSIILTNSCNMYTPPRYVENLKAGGSIIDGIFLHK